MSVLLEALSRANARKEAIWGKAETAKTDHNGVCMMLSGVDLDPGDIAGYLDAAACVFLTEWACGESHDQVVQGALIEGLLMGMMIERVHQDRIDRGYLKPSEPGVIESARSLLRACVRWVEDQG